MHTIQETSQETRWTPWVWSLLFVGGLLVLPIHSSRAQESEGAQGETTSEATSAGESGSTTSAEREGSSTPERQPTSASSSSDDGPPESSGSPSGEGIDIDVTGGSKRTLIPMAVPDTREPDGDTEGVAPRVQEILRHDLELSGFFKILPPDSFFFDPSEGGMSAVDIDFKNWFNVGAQGLIKSAVRVDGDQVVLDLKLFKVDTGERIELDWSGGAVPREKYEQKVHAFVNAVLKHYTGTTGIFGTRIAFVQKDDSGLKQIYTSELDGSNRVQVTNNNSINLLPSWGPGGQLYYTSYRHHNPDLWVYHDGEHDKLSSQPGQNSGADYCGGTVALTMARGGENADIYLIDPESGEVEERLTDNWSIDTSPSWSPDCSKIAFVSGRSGSPQIYAMDADGSNKKRLTYEGTYNTSPDWSPEGDEIAFTARDKYNRFDIFTVTLDRTLTRLTQDQGNNEEPDFSPDGRYIIFSSDRGGQGERLWIMTSDGEIQKPLIPDESGFSAPVWKTSQ
jgi:TolB protein